MRLTVSQSVRQAGRQAVAVNEAGRQAGRNTQLGLFGVSLHLPTKKRLVAAATDSSRVEKQAGHRPVSVRFPDQLAGRVMVYPSAVLQTRVQIPLSTNL